MVDKLIIRQAVSEDIDSICRIEDVSFPTSWRRDTYEKEMERDLSIFLVAETETQVIGFALSWAYAGELHILKVAVDPTFRRGGIAMAMMERTNEIARRRLCLLGYLEVRPSNPPALRLYEKLGYQKAGMRKNYYTDTNEDAIIMAIKLEYPTFVKDEDDASG